ncbi:LysR substrate-binding domain-containing protein [Allosediminivita pacifica]|uniref:DNA-binding transcriptional LysR family regulator n=1 Tax=Allosediminivita pacifica TaxID=1267769 RepID=A0A2T6AFX5_9RHOB|nr:LysR substrate-binding domain-containing protein [Allosediminivita pacifica]PTX42705.1 DNA-binding transcriptional LysR family regulator [Allosediminivita pacifica]GGB06280.1 LysR family transcriptional regulator [Allosediminivita pacifica]
MSADISLLRVFHAVMEERNVTAAARRLGQSQSTVSAALARLRHALGDELFLRARYGVEPTEKALQIAPDVAAGLARLEQAFRAAEPFDPARSTRRFRLLLGPYAEVVLAPPLAAAFARDAPGAKLEIAPIGPDLDPRSLAGQSFDLALGRFHPPPEDLVVSELFSDGFRCIVAPGALGGDATLDRSLYERLPHVVVAPPGNWRTGLHKLTADTGLRRNTSIIVSHFLMAAPTVARIGGIATVPARIAAMVAEPYGLLDMPVPLDLGTFPTEVAWHPHNRSDAPNTWLRDLLYTLVSAELQGLH